MKLKTKNNTNLVVGDKINHLLITVRVNDLKTIQVID
jgi:hypothetical protein